MRTYRRLLAAATVAVTLAGALTVGSRADRAEAAIGGITWSDEFNGAAGAAVDGTKWKLRHRRRRLGQQRAAVLHQLHQQRRAWTGRATW